REDPVVVFDTLFEVISKVLDFIPEWRKKNEEKADYILTTFYTALNETNIYANNMLTKPRDERFEEQLSRLWLKAAMAVRRVDGQLGQECVDFARYWGMPSLNVKHYAIKHKPEIEAGFQKLRELMRTLA